MTAKEKGAGEAPPASDGALHYPIIQTAAPQPSKMEGHSAISESEVEVKVNNRIAELEVEVSTLKAKQLELESEVAARDKRVHELIAEITELEKELPAGRTPKGPPQRWKTGIFEITADSEICILGTFLPCVLFGQTASQLLRWEEKEVHRKQGGCCNFSGTMTAGHDFFRFFTHCLMFCMLGGMCQVVTLYILGPMASVITLAPCFAFEYRTKLRNKYNLREAPLTDFATSCLCLPCAVCQEAREIKIRQQEVDDAKLEAEKQKIRGDVRRELEQEAAKKAQGELPAAVTAAPPVVTTMTK